MSRKNITQVFGLEFARKHAGLFKLAQDNGLALCGSTAVALVKGNSDYIPKDLDFVGNDTGCVEDFITDVCLLMSKYPSHWRIYGNSKNKFCAGWSTLHMRIITPFWLPVCVFGIPPGSLKKHAWKGNVYIQDINSVKKQAELFKKLDGKDRFAITEQPQEIHEPAHEPHPPTNLEQTQGEEVPETYQEGV